MFFLHTLHTPPPPYHPRTSQHCHTPAQFTSMNPSPQAGDTQLDFIPLPTSAPPQPYTIPDADEGAKYEKIPDADEGAKYETPISTPLTSSGYQHSATPSLFLEYANGHYTNYKDQQQHQQPYDLPPYPVPPSRPNQTSQQPSYDNVTFVEATPIDLSDGKYKLSPAGGGSTFLQNLRNPRKKSFWIVLIIVLAIIFGVLGATIWKTDSNKNNGNGNPTATPSASTTAPPPTSKPTGTKEEYFRFCRELCLSPWNSCCFNCEFSDAAYKACVEPCYGDLKCEVNCKNSNGCLKDCNGTLDRCSSACPSYTP
ncbi:hypothetical protein BGZ74_011573 [Mortierella antarctica]|nr:hypothetical protein BGZ74_011573 [Mortierella antarctica]